MARFEGGWIKLYRSAIEGDIGSNPICLAVFVRLLAWANLKPTTIRFNGAPRDIPRGSLVIGIRELAEKIGCARGTAYRSLVYLEKRDTIRREVGTEGTLITVINFEKYQSSEITVEQERDTDGTLSEREVGHEVNPIEEYKNKRNISRRTSAEYTAEFESLYNQYPRKEGKAAGFRIYLRSIKTDQDRQRLAIAIRNYADQIRREGREAQYTKQFSTFMNNWQDYEVIQTSQAPAATPLHQVRPI